MAKYIFYTVRQVATMLGVHWQTILNYIKRGELKAVRLGRGYRISQSALDEFTNKNSTGSNKK